MRRSGFNSVGDFNFNPAPGGAIPTGGGPIPGGATSDQVALCSPSGILSFDPATHLLTCNDGTQCNDTKGVCSSDCARAVYLKFDASIGDCVIDVTASQQDIDQAKANCTAPGTHWDNVFGCIDNAANKGTGDGGGGPVAPSGSSKGGGDGAGGPVAPGPVKTETDAQKLASAQKLLAAKTQALKEAQAKQKQLQQQGASGTGSNAASGGSSAALLVGGGALALLALYMVTRKKTGRR